MRSCNGLGSLVLPATLLCILLALGGGRDLMAESATVRLPLDGPWAFGRTRNDADSSLPVPGVWDAARSSAEDWRFSREIEIPQAARGRPLSLRFGGVDYACEVAWDGKPLGSHAGYFEPFWLDAGTANPRHNLEVAVSSPWEEDDSRRMYAGHLRKTTLKGVDNISWGRNLAGIWRPLEAICGDAWIHRFSCRWLPEKKIVRFDLVIVRPAAGEIGIVDLELRLEPEAAGRGGAGLRLERNHLLDPGENRFTVDAPFEPSSLWAPATPALWRATATLLSHGGALDSASRVTGFRRFEIRDRVVRLNGEPLFLRGLADYGFLRGVVGIGDIEEGARQRKEQKYFPLPAAGITDRSERFIRTLLSANCNTVRVAHLVLPDEFYEAADRLGILVYQDFPLHWMYDFERMDPAWVRRQFESFLWDMGDHPSVAIVACANEYMGVPEEKGTRLLEDLLSACREWAPTTLRIGNSGAEGRAAWRWPKDGGAEEPDASAFDERSRKQDAAAGGMALDDDIADYHRYIFAPEGEPPLPRQRAYLEAVLDRAASPAGSKPFFLSEFAAKIPEGDAALYESLDRAQVGEGGNGELEGLSVRWNERFGDIASYEEALRSGISARSLIQGGTLRMQVLETRRRWMQGAAGCTAWFASSILRDLDTPSETFGVVRDCYAPVALYIRPGKNAERERLEVWILADDAIGECEIAVAGALPRKLALNSPGAHREIFTVEGGGSGEAVLRQADRELARCRLRVAGR